MPSVSLGWHRHKNDLFSIVLIDSSREKVRKMVHNGAVMEKNGTQRRTLIVVHFLFTMCDLYLSTMHMLL